MNVYRNASETAVFFNCTVRVFLRYLIIELKLLNLGTLFESCVTQIVGSICAVSSSLNVGKAGPMVHCGACIAALLGQGGSKKFGLTWKWLRFFKNDRDRRDLVTCGSAAGIAAAFRAPVGGVLFSLEEMASWYYYLTS